MKRRVISRFSLLIVGFMLAYVAPLSVTIAGETESEEGDVVSVVKNFDNGIPIIVFTARRDTVIINAVVLNRSNCKQYPSPPLPAELKFGDSYSVLAACGYVIEATVKTDGGEFTFNW